MKFNQNSILIFILSNHNEVQPKLCTVVFMKPLAKLSTAKGRILRMRVRVRVRMRVRVRVRVRVRARVRMRVRARH
jgi:hypothetical protein